jgi:hypothetical protein
MLACCRYEKGLKLAEAHLGPEHGISDTLRNSLLEARAQSEGKGSKTKGAGASKGK